MAGLSDAIAEGLQRIRPKQSEEPDLTGLAEGILKAAERSVEATYMPRADAARTGL